MALARVVVAVWLTALPLSAASPAMLGGPSPQTESNDLKGTAWNAVELYDAALPADSAPADRRPHLVFGADGRLSGADGCNRLTGPYTVKANGITFGAIAGTRMACPKTDELAARFNAALKGTSHWSIVKDRLEFYGATGKPLAVFEKRPADAGKAAAASRQKRGPARGAAARRAAASFRGGAIT